MTTTDFDYDEWSRLTKDQKCERLLAEAETDEDRAWIKRLPPTTGRSTPMRSNAAARPAARRISDAGAATKSNFTAVTATASPAAKGTCP